MMLAEEVIYSGCHLQGFVLSLLNLKGEEVAMAANHILELTNHAFLGCR